MIKNAVYICRSTVKLWDAFFYPGNQVTFLDSGKDEFEIEISDQELFEIQTIEENIIVCSKYLFSTNFILLTKKKG